MESNYKILQRDDFLCQKCKSNQALTIHHVVHKEFGGGDSKDNLITLCYDDHLKWHAYFENLAKSVGRDKAKHLIKERFWTYLYSSALEDVEKNKKENTGRAYTLLGDLQPVVPRKRKKRKKPPLVINRFIRTSLKKRKSVDFEGRI